MKLKEIAIVVGATAGLSLAAPTWVMAQGNYGSDQGYSSQSSGSTSQSSGAMSGGEATNEMPSGQSAQAPSGASTQNSVQNMKVSELEGKDLYDSSGNAIGKISSVVRNKNNNSLQAVVSAGGFLGIGQTKVTVPVDQLSVNNQGQLVASNIASPNDLAQQQAYDAKNYSPVQPSETIAAASSAASAGGTGAVAAAPGLPPSEQPLGGSGAAGGTSGSSASSGASSAMPPSDMAMFDQLDTNHDGMISKSEAQKDPALEKDFQAADTNGDNEIEPSEFSAFEQSQGSQGGASGASGASSSNMGGASSSNMESGSSSSNMGSSSSDMGASSSASGGMSGTPSSEMASFDSIDTNHDGYISKSEAESAGDQTLVNDWSSADANGDNEISPSEFSAFEASQPSTGAGAPSGSESGSMNAPSSSGSSSSGTSSEGSEGSGM